MDANGVVVAAREPLSKEESDIVLSDGELVGTFVSVLYEIISTREDIFN